MSNFRQVRWKQKVMNNRKNWKFKFSFLPRVLQELIGLVRSARLTIREPIITFISQRSNSSVTPHQNEKHVWKAAWLLPRNYSTNLSFY